MQNMEICDKGKIYFSYYVLFYYLMFFYLFIFLR